MSTTYLKVLISYGNVSVIITCRDIAITNAMQNIYSTSRMQECESQVHNDCVSKQKTTNGHTCIEKACIVL